MKPKILTERTLGPHEVADNVEAYLALIFEIDNSLRAQKAVMGLLTQFHDNDPAAIEALAHLYDQVYSNELVFRSELEATGSLTDRIKDQIDDMGIEATPQNVLFAAGVVTLGSVALQEAVHHTFWSEAAAAKIGIISLGLSGLMRFLEKRR